MKSVVPSHSQFQYDPDLDTYFTTGTWFFKGHTIQVSWDKFGYHVSLDVTQVGHDLKTQYDAKIWLGNRLR